MQIHFTKMQGAGNDFVVLDETRTRLGLSPAQYRFLADRHFGVGADQILTVRPAPTHGVDFEYVIHNADGGQVQQCGNGARCFARYVRDKGLTDKDVIRVYTRAGVIEPRLDADGRVTVNMGVPVFDPALVPFDTRGLAPRVFKDVQQWPLVLEGQPPHAAPLWLVPVSMGNPHAVQIVDDVDVVPVTLDGPQLECHWRFPERVNASWLQVQQPYRVRLRVHERGAGETLACGTGACAAVAAGIRLGLLAERVDVLARGGCLTVSWSGGASDCIWLAGPAVTVFEGRIDIPDTP